jgi:hypothetical protein
MAKYIDILKLANQKKIKKQKYKIRDSKATLKTNLSDSHHDIFPINY